MASAYFSFRIRGDQQKSGSTSKGKNGVLKKIGNGNAYPPKSFYSLFLTETIQSEKFKLHLLPLKYPTPTRPTRTIIPSIAATGMPVWEELEPLFLVIS